jgi:NifU-like protein involved in Fe-S cluster formation
VRDFTKISIWDLTDEDRKSMNAAGFSQKALDLFHDREYLGELDDPSVCHTAESKAGEKLRYSIKVQNDIITEASLVYQGCPALAACAAETIHHILKSKVAEEMSTTPKEIWEGLGSHPLGHDDHVDFSLKTMIETLKIYLDQKHLGEKEHEEYIHLCGLLGRK